MAVASKLADNQVTLINELSFAAPKTKNMAGILKALKIDGQSVLVAVPAYDVNVYKSIRNLADVAVLPVADLNTLSVLQPRRLLMTPAALDACERRARPPRGDQGPRQAGRGYEREEYRSWSRRKGPRPTSSWSRTRSSSARW